MTFLPHVPKLAIAIIASCLCLVVLHLLRGRTAEAMAIQQPNLKNKRQSASARTFQLILAVLTGFIFTVVITNRTLKFFGAQRIHVVSKLIGTEVAKTDPTRNQIVLVGSSQTQQQIDEVLLEKLLNQSGAHYQVIQLAVPALFNIEADTVLEEYLARTSHRPTAIFIDTGFDAEYLPTIDQRRDALAVAASSWSHTWQRIKRSWLRHGTDIIGVRPIATRMNHAMAFLSDVTDSLNFFLCNVSNCAELRQLDPAAPGQYAAGVDPLSGHDPNFKADSVLAPAALACRMASQKMPADLIEPSVSFRRWQAEKYTAGGAVIVGFYYPPNLDVRTACFQRDFCSRIGAYPCLTLDDTSLLVDLNSYNIWYDPHHVNNRGVPTFTALFARDIEKLFAPGKAPADSGQYKSVK